MSTITRADIRRTARDNGWTVSPTGLAPERTHRTDIFTRPGSHRISVQYRYIEGKGFAGGVARLYRDGWTIDGAGKGQKALDLLNKDRPGGSLKAEGA